MSTITARPKHVRRLSLFGLGAPQALSQGEQTPRPNTSTASIVFSLTTSTTETDEKGAPGKLQSAPVRRKLSKKRKPPQKAQSLAAPSPQPTTAYSLSNTQLSELSHESDISFANHRKPSLRRKTSINVRAALSSIFIPKPSRKTVAGILDGMDSISGGKGNERGRGSEKKKTSTYRYESRSPSPPSPEIRPPSGLGQIASSVDLSTYIQDEYEGSVLLSRSRTVSRAPSIAPSINLPASQTPPSEDTTANTSPVVNHTKSLKSSDSSNEFSYRASLHPPTPPSPTLIKVLNLTTPYCSLDSLSSLATASKELTRDAQNALYANIDSDDVGDDEKRRRRLLQTIASNAEVGNIVKCFRWVCLPTPPSSSSSSLKRNIPRRVPTFSLSTSSEEYILPRVLSATPNLETLTLVQPHSIILRWFLPLSPSPPRSPNTSPVSPSMQMPPPTLSSLRSLTLSGRTTLSTTFGSLLVRFLELHPGIRELNLPDVFCLPNVHTLSRRGSASSSSASSPVSTPGLDSIPPVPPLPPVYASMKDKEPPAPPMLPNLTRLVAPLSLATQLIPGRPLRVVDIELTTSLYEGLRPSEIVRALSEARDVANQAEGTDANKKNWRAARQARRFGPTTTGTPQNSPSQAKFENDNLKCTSWKAARIARRAGTMNHMKPTPSLRELRLRCTAKVDGRTIGKVLNALGAELGLVLETLAIGWSGSEAELNSQLTSVLPRYHVLQRLDISKTSVDVEDEEGADEQDSEADIQAGITRERYLVEQWSRLCPQLSHIEFTSGRIWRAS
ncbi:uncharacterized protein FOMMEDRAFT_161896 [Fomitiporia mediterranea MF3/22]|uniref:uncharacterized protein n=1 Tax=Fomitiporia mediterranea (strain MF3/22) TaxID=694068 RepID=UPI000440978F|nr:uncharacterized protein FOMMEDRAFT_161896 [Fomitiporia mediterranea MF3/22]EJC98521.1 hypothetical protein FOMMEDRAFT_161896 [Fomitiporia mediterranea MF3/22]